MLCTAVAGESALLISVDRRLRKIEGRDRQERLFPRTKEISGFLPRYDFSAEHAQRVLQQNRPNAAICDFHNDGPTPCEEANRRIFIDSGFNVRYFTFRLINHLMY
jgi:hypothetical protein